MNTPDADSGAKSPFLSDALVLALLTGYSYLMAFAYKSGYYAYFCIPVELVELNITTILIALGALGLFCILMFHLANLAVTILSGTSYRTTLLGSAVGRSVARIIIYTLFVLLLLFLDKGHLIPLAGYLLIAFYALLEFLPILSFRGSPWKEKFEKQEEVENSTLDIPTMLQKKWGRKYFLFVVSGLLLVWLIYLIGTFSAGSATDFLVVSDRPSVEVVVDFSGGNAICLVFDGPTTKPLQVPAGLRIYDESTLSNLRLEKQHVGRILRGKARPGYKDFV